MGDTLRFERTPGGGRTVILTLPAAAQRSAAPDLDRLSAPEEDLTIF